jgi:charged multivesicular body protein 4
MALKRKKAYEAQVQKLSGARMTIESQLMAIEGATVNLETINAMREGAAALQGIHGSMYKQTFFALSRMSPPDEVFRAQVD